MDFGQQEVAALGLRILYGTSQAALVEACVNEIDSAGDPFRAMLLVPEQTKAEAERLYLERTGRSGILLAEILSFSRLAYRVLGEIGGLSRDCVDTIGKSILLHSLLKENRSQLRSLGVGAGRPGFVPQVAHVLGDLRRHGVEPGPLRKAAESAHGEDMAFSAKAEDLAFLMEHYSARMTDLGLYDREDDLWRLADAFGTLKTEMDKKRGGGGDLPWPVSRGEFLASTSVWIAGFAQTRDFTPQEYAVLSGLVDVCAQVTVTVCSDAVPESIVSAEFGPDAFRIGRRTAGRLAARYRGTTARQVPSVPAQPFDRIGLAIVQGSDPPADPDLIPEDAPAVTTAVFRGREEEIRWVAGEIRRLTLTCGYRYTDISIGVSSPAAYLAPLRAVFREFGLSPFIDEPRPLVGTPLYRFLRGLLDLQVQDWSLPAMTACLRSDFCSIRRDEADLLENFYLSRGITGASRVFDDRRYRAGYDSLTVLPSSDSEEDGLEPEPDELAGDRHGRKSSDTVVAREAKRIRDRVLQPLREFLKKMAADPSCLGKCRLLSDFLEAYGVRDAVEKRAAGLHASSEDEAAITLVRAWNSISRVLEQMSVIAGTGRYGMEEFRDALAAGMEGAQSGAIPPVIDRIAVSGYARAGFRRARAIFLLGADEDSFPGTAAPEGLLKDPDRERISRQLDVRLPSVLRDQVFADAALAYGLMTAPADALYMTVPANGRPPSGYMDLLRSVVPEGRHLTVGPPDTQDPRIGARRPAHRYLLSASADPTVLGDAGRLAVLRALADTLGLSEMEQERGRWHGWLEEDRVTVQLPAGLVRAATGVQPTMSVSQLERYSACPFAYFSQYLIRLQERDVWSPQATDAGSVLHGILELAVRNLGEELSKARDDKDRLATLERWNSLDFKAFAGDCMRLIAERDGYGMFYDAGIRASGGRRVLHLGAASLRAVIGQFSVAGVAPIHTEWHFGTGDSANADALTLNVRGVRVTFRGVIDRVDRINRVAESDPGDPGTSDASVNTFRIIDYKSGDIHFDPDKVFYGLSLQLPAYATAYRGLHPGFVPTEMGYFRFQAPVAAYAAHEGSREAVDSLERIDRQFKLHCTGLSPGEIEEVTCHTMGRMHALCGALLSGKADARPARIGPAPAACRYCSYKALCGHEGKTFFHMKPLAELVSSDVESKRMKKMIHMIRRTAAVED